MLGIRYVGSHFLRGLARGGVPPRGGRASQFNALGSSPPGPGPPLFRLIEAEIEGMKVLCRPVQKEWK